MKPPVLFACFMVLLFSACAPRLIQATPAQRSASFAAYNNLQIENKSAYKFLTCRSALLIRADRVNMTQSGKHTGYFELENKKPDGIILGTATAIDKRGYFLTAAHCVDEGAPFLAFYEDGQITLRPSRIVWSGQPAKGEPDLALLWVSESLDCTFDWASDFQAHEKVLATGNGIQRPDKIESQCEAGQILWIVEKPTVPPPVVRISHDVPLRFGDSGGPLTDERGKLIGINVILQGDFHLMKMAYVQSRCVALRPDLKWLTRVIDQDQAKLSQKSRAN